MGVDAGQLGIVLLVGLPPAIVLASLSDHADAQHEHERDDCTGWTERGKQRDGLKRGGYQEVDVGVSFELEEEGQGEEGEDVVLGGRDVVGSGSLAMWLRDLDRERVAHGSTGAINNIMLRIY